MSTATASAPDIQMAGGNSNHERKKKTERLSNYAHSTAASVAIVSAISHLYGMLHSDANFVYDTRSTIAINFNFQFGHSYKQQIAHAPRSKMTIINFDCLKSTRVIFLQKNASAHSTGIHRDIPLYSKTSYVIAASTSNCKPS